jgi:hypothetical protein
VKWPTVLRNRASGSPAEPRFSSRLPVHLLRFAILVVGLLAVSELFLASSSCLQHVENIKTLNDVFECASIGLFYLVWLGLDYLPIRLTPVVILALLGTIVWAWRERGRS